MGCCLSEEIKEFSYAGTYDAVVTRVVDGDTFDAVFAFRGTKSIFRIRIAGIDTPEMHPKRKGLTLDDITLIKTNAIKAKEALANLILHKPVKLIVGKSKEKYGRILATVLCDGTNVSERMIKSGYGVPYDGKKKTLKGNG